MKKIHSLCLILILVTAGNCKKESEEVDPVTRLFALQFLLNKKDVFFSTVRFLNEKFYAPGSAGQLYVSTDGDTWTKQSLGTFQTLKDIGFNKDVFTIVGNAVH